MAIDAMDQVRRAEMATDAQAVRAALGAGGRKTLRQLLWGMRRNPSTWSARQLDAMHWLQRSTLKSARAWRLKMALRAVYARATAHNSIEQAASDLRAWLSWARRCRLEPFKKLAATLKERFDAVVRGMVDHRSNAFVEAMNGLLQQASARLVQCCFLAKDEGFIERCLLISGPQSLACSHNPVLHHRRGRA